MCAVVKSDTLRNKENNQSLVGSVVISAELGRDDHSSISRNCDQKGAGTT
jgi:hypothetical protein